MNGPGKLVFVPEENLRTISRGFQPQYVTVSQDVLFEVVADIGEDGHVVTKRHTVVSEL